TRRATGSPRGVALRDSALGSLVRAHPAACVVLACYALAAAVIPTLTAAPVSDDWVYSRSVEILLREGDLRVLDLSVITLLFQVAWGGFFSLLFGLSFGAMRLSTVVLTALSGVAFYAMLGQLAVPRPRAAIGTAVYLFNPLAFVLGFSFMTDPQFTAMLVITMALTVRGLRPDAPSRQATVLGSVAAAGTILVRQQGVLIPFAVVLYLIAARRLRPDRAGLRLFLDVVAIPAATTVAYYAWLFFIHGVPEQQDAFLDQVFGAGIGGTWELVRLMTVVEMVYLGFIVLPLVLGALAGARHLIRRPRLPGAVFLGAWLAVLVAGLAWFAGGPAGFGPLKMPYVSQFVGLHGLGPSDLWGGRPWLNEDGVVIQDVWTYASAFGSLVFAVAIGRKLGGPRSPDRAGAALVAVIGVWQVIGVLPPSFHFRTWIISVDRYLLPLLPVAIALFLWSLRGVRFSTPVAWAAIAAVGIYSMVATRDFLVFQDATWEFAAYAHEEIGVPLTRLDAGSSWDGYHLYEFSVANAIPHQSPGGPWWTNLFATATDSSFVITSAIGTPPGYQVIAWTEYSSWLHDRPVYLFLMQRIEVVPPSV
ncbi:MAG: glycosyltransferase family 39 protein, partial [Chloroflexia bacterium]|nr:glycosyltransferase family 39 protein [Chloroflexia bacterium]